MTNRIVGRDTPDDNPEVLDRDRLRPPTEPGRASRAPDANTAVRPEGGYYPLDYDIEFELFDPATYSYVTYTYGELILAGLMPDGLKDVPTQLTYWQNRAQSSIDDNGLPRLGGGGGRRGGGGGPEYVAPDEASVREQVKGYVVATLGSVDQELIDKATGVLLKADKEAFDKRETQQIDGWQRVKDTVRASEKYKSIHRLRPESVDELEWVVGRQQKLRQLGVDATRAEDLGAAQAQGGATDEDLVAAADLSSATHKEIGTRQRRALTQAAYNVARMIK